MNGVIYWSTIGLQHHRGNEANLYAGLCMDLLQTLEQLPITGSLKILG